MLKCDLRSIMIIRGWGYSNVCLLPKNRDWVHRELSLLVQRDRDRVWIPEYHSEPAYTRLSGRYAEDGASEEQGLLLLIMGGCSRVSAFGFVQTQNERGWMDVGQNIRSEKVMRYYWKEIVLTSTSLINQELTRNRAGLHGLVDSVQLEYILTEI